MHRFAAKLLFQFRVDINGDPGKRRTCEERILNFKARSIRSALSQAKRRGKRAEFDYPNSDGNTVYFEFVGVLALIELGLEADADEVWYEIHDRLQPMERRDQIIPSDADLVGVVKRTV